MNPDNCDPGLSELTEMAESIVRKMALMIERGGPRNWPDFIDRTFTPEEADLVRSAIGAER